MGLPEGAGQEHVPVHQVRFRRSNGVEALGEAAIALTFSHDGLQPTTEGYPIGAPSPPSGHEVGAMALIKGGPADEQENAKKFIDFMLCREQFLPGAHQLHLPAEGLVTLDSITIDYDAVWLPSTRTSSSRSSRRTSPALKIWSNSGRFSLCLQDFLPGGEEVLLPNA